MHTQRIRKAKRVLARKQKHLDALKSEGRRAEYEREEKKVLRRVNPVIKLDKREKLRTKVASK